MARKTKADLEQELAALKAEQAAGGIAGELLQELFSSLQPTNHSDGSVMYLISGAWVTSAKKRLKG